MHHNYCLIVHAPRLLFYNLKVQNYAMILLYNNTYATLGYTQVTLKHAQADTIRMLHYSEHTYVTLEYLHVFLRNAHAT